MAMSNPVAEAMRQMGRGEDFWPADDLTRDLSPEQATKIPEGCPYSIATQVGHMLCWQDRWIDQIQGQPVKDSVSDEEDFPVVKPEEWMDLRARLVTGIEMASGLATGLETDRTVGTRSVSETLLKVAIHNAYHIGQIALLRQIAGFGMPVYDQK
jgi:uncharacterized damage-inducible protein DinB